MPGIFGGVGVSPGAGTALSEAFLNRWPDTRVERYGSAVLGGHAFGGASAIHAVEPGRLVALDGEWSLYREVPDRLERDPDRFLDTVDDALGPDVMSAGNLVVVAPRDERVRIAVDPTATFPLYYTEHEGGLLFSSLLRPLARVVSAELDDLAILEFLRQAYTVGGKTVFEGIRRFLPGQALVYSPGDSVAPVERSRAWTGRSDLDADEAAERAWSGLDGTLRRGLAAGRSSLMLSGGWDSRTLLASALHSGGRVSCYSHGDPSGREIRIVRDICQAAGVPLRVEPIDDRILDPDLLTEGFDRTENVVFPHWHRAGRILAEADVACVTAGVFGEILGGHYGPAMLEGTAGKIRSVGRTLLGLGAGTRRAAGVSHRQYLRVRPLDRHWYLQREYEESIDRPRERMNAAVETAIDRLEARGVNDDLAKVEAFITEHRGTQYINAQLLSCRAFTDVAVPFAGKELYTFSTRVPLEAKIHNALNRRMLERHAPSLLRYPMAATLVPAGAPLLIQEASRAVRKVWERAAITLNVRTGGRVPRPRLGWLNFDFLRDGSALHRLADDLRRPLWDRDEIHARIDHLGQAKPESVHPFFDQFAKVYTIDRLVR